MKATKNGLSAALDKPDPDIRFYLFHGENEGQSRAHGERLLKGLQAEKFAVSAQALKSDPALLADEAGAIAMFGGRRAIWIEPCGDEISEAVGALLELPAAESPVVAIAGGLRKTSSLVRLSDSHRLALAHISYDLEQKDVIEMVDVLARQEGLKLAGGVAARIAAAAGNERGIIAQELVKIALYVGAAPDRPVEVDREIVDSIGAGHEGDWTRIGDLALSGDVKGLARELDCSGAEAEPISVLRSLQRRLLALAPIRARVDLGERPHDAVTSAGKSLFWKDKELFVRLVTAWDSAALERVMERCGELERRLLRRGPPPGPEAVENELVAIARVAQRR